MSRLGERMQRPGRIIGTVADLLGAAFMLLLVGQAAEGAAEIGIAYLVAAAVVLLAPRPWAAAAAIATAVVTGLFAIVSGAMNLLDGLILGTASLMAAWAAWDLVRHADPEPPPPAEAL